MHERQFVDAFSQHILPLRLRRFRMPGIIAPQGRDKKLAICKQHLGEPATEQLAEAAADTDLNVPFDDEEDDGSYVPCPVCDKRMQLRFSVDANVICNLLDVAAGGFALLQARVVTSIRQAIGQVIGQVIGGSHKHGCAHRTKIPFAFECNGDLMLIVATLIEDQLRDASGHQERAPLEAAA